MDRGNSVRLTRDPAMAMARVPASFIPTVRRFSRRLRIGLFLDAFPQAGALLAVGCVALVCRLFVPSVAPYLYRTVRHFMNWPAFAVTVLYVIATSIVWEVTLALSRGWWGFQPDAMVGVYVQAWDSAMSRFPIEEIGVWLAAPFFTLLTYEFAKAFFHHPGSSRTALFGSRKHALPGEPVQTS